jgi:ubiquinone/menaquinone biosynthesis C-methylase UbiE
MDKQFDKYHTQGPDYHFRQIRPSLRDYNASVDARFNKLIENVLSLAKVAKSDSIKILDVGCGDGVALYLISQKLPQARLYGIDPEALALKIAKEKIPQGEFLQGKADELPFEDNFFDMVISSDVIEHVNNPDDMLLEIKRVAKQGADIIVGTPIKHSKIPLDHNHVQEWFVEDFLALVEKYFVETNLHESHNLIPYLLYSFPPRSFLNFKYLINLLSLIFGYNPFMKERVNRMQMFAYMYITCKK